MATQINTNQIKDGAAVKIITVSHTEATFDTTTSEQTLATLTLPADLLYVDSQNQSIELHARLLIKTDNSQRVITYRVKLGATTIFSIAVDENVNGAQTWGLVDLLLEIRGNDATNAQLAEGFLLVGEQTGTSNGFTFNDSDGSAAEDSTGALTITITGQPAVSDADIGVGHRSSKLLGPFVPK